MQLRPTLQYFFAEMQRRKVLRVATGYVVAAWIVLQVAVALQTAWKLSDTFSGTILNLMILGFPAAVGLTWFFELTPQGIKRTTGSGDGAIAKLQTTDFVLAGALALVFCIGVAQFFWPREVAQEVASSTDTKTAGADAEKLKVELPRLGDKSIAVLPFVNLSPDKDDAYLADGLTEETLDTVAQLHGVSVISRTSSFAFKGSTSPLREIAQQLSVRYLLEGSVRRAGDDVRITAQLIDATTDTHVWSKTFEPKFEDIFGVQDDIAQAIARALDVELKLAAGPRGAPTSNMEAYRANLKALELALAGDLGSYPEVIELQKRATTLDPKFAQAHANLAVHYMASALSGGGKADDAIPLAWASVREAQRLDPEYAQASLGNMALFKLRWAESKDHLLRAIERNPSDAYPRLSLASTSTIMGYFDQADQAAKAAARLDPLNRNVAVAVLLNAFARKDDKTVAAMATKLAGASGPLAAYGHWFFACLAQTQGDRVEAERQFKAAMAARGDHKALLEPVSAAIRSPAAVPRAVKALAAEAAADPSFQPEHLLYLIDPEDGYIDALNARLARSESFWVSWWMPNAWRLVQRDGGPSPKVKQLLRNVGLVDYWRAQGWPDRCRAKGEDDFECS